MAYSNKCRVQSASGIGIRDQRSETGDWSSRFAHIPVLLASMDHLGLAELVDERFVPHKNWDGVSLGKALSGWLTHILSEGDHRLSQVQDWAAKRPETMFQFGHSKHHRPDLPQVKVMLATLDPLGMPVATQVVAGQKADDPLYIPAIDQVRPAWGSVDCCTWVTAS